MSNGNGHRWSKFWWCDWQNDKGLQQCSLAARGLWIELLGLCHASEKPGYLLINGEPPDNEALADVLGLGKTNAKEITKLLAELERRRVFSRDESGTLYSRRMVRDVVASEEGREHIAKRWRAGDPNTPPNRGPSRKPNGKANSDPTRDPFTRSLEAEEEAEPPVGPHGVGTGTPAEPGTPPARRADGTNSRALGTNPRETGANPRANGSNPRAQSSNPRSKNRFHDKAREMDAQGVTIDGLPQPIVDFYAATGVRPKLIGGASG